ncbi:MAG TPA: SpoVA/SpoVAEb family sporulation membrane protein [Firmicutes bacterium]|nr:SpoVA/SpoVAEb family sporulation membrane protein [Bacillota bacterium]
MKPKDYQKLVNQNTPKVPLVSNMAWAFLVGGLFCAFGQLVLNGAEILETTKNEAAAVTLAAMIFVGTVLTGFGIYDEIAEKAGAGAAVPITGFANTIASAAMEFRREGLLLGMGARMFTIAGPVIVYGVLAGFFVTVLKALILGLF